MLFGGLDVGTTGCKVSIYNEHGEFIHNSYCEYESTRNSNVHEIDAESVWQGVKKVLYAALDEVGEIHAVTVTTFGESFVLLDSDDNVLLPSMLYTDTRGSDEAKRLDSDMVMNITGVKPHSMYSIPKLMWIRENMREIYEKTDKILLFQDYIIYMLTKNRQIDYSLAARTMGFDIRKRTWSEEIFEMACIDKGKMSTPVCAGTSAGYAKLSGLENTIIVNGCHDQMAAVLGGGVFSEGNAIDCTGTVACTTPVFTEIPQDNAFYDEGYCVVPHIFEGQYVCYAVSFAGGAALKWYKDNFASEISYKDLDKAIADEPTGILLVPHFAGAGTPYMDEDAEAIFAGITLGTTKLSLYRAVMEGVAYEMRLNHERLKDFGISIDTLYCAGGGAKSDAWLQIKADVLGREVVALADTESGALGGAMLAAIGAGISIDDAKKSFVGLGKSYKPDMKKHEEYSKLYAKYKEIYKASKLWR